MDGRSAVGWEGIGVRKLLGCKARVKEMRRGRPDKELIVLHVTVDQNQRPPVNTSKSSSPPAFTGQIGAFTLWCVFERPNLPIFS